MVLRSSMVYNLLLYNWWVTNGFTFFSGQEKNKINIYNMWNLYKIWIVVSINEVLPEDIYVYCVSIIYNFLCYNVKLSSCNKDCMTLNFKEA